MIVAVVAMAEKTRAIGQNNQLLWHLPDDFKHFKQLTLGKPVLMGRKTFESIGRRGIAEVLKDIKEREQTGK